MKRGASNSSAHVASGPHAPEVFAQKYAFGTKNYLQVPEIIFTAVIFI